MHSILNYEIEKKLYDGPNSIVYRGKNKDSNQSVILKLLKKEYPTAEEIVRFKREFEITHNINEIGVNKPFEIVKYQNSFIIIFEDISGDSIANYLMLNSFTLKQFLPLAIQITESIASVHQKKIIHKDINPSNIIWNLSTNKVKLIDFGISSELSHETANLKNPNVLEGTLNYMSPEQTGRMNRAIDYRTDLYSLGASFYQMLTGQVPFTSQDAMELVHSHIAIDPTPPHEINSEIPEILTKIILKLMAKTAENRYQNALGLSADLNECLNQLNQNGVIKNFPLGNNDIPDRFEIPQKLYGREKEVESLLSSFDRIKKGVKEIIFISGYSGIGKSSIVQEIYKPIVQRKGMFIRGKFDQYKRNIPYASIIQAFQELIKQILTESKEELAIRKEDLLSALGQNSQVIMDVFPDLKIIIGEQPIAIELSPSESRNRFNFVFRNFVLALVNKPNPLVIFLDDLQWADLPSLNLLELLITDSEIGNLLLIGAYRDNEVSPTHPLVSTIKEIENKKIPISTIKLSPLNISNVSNLISDTILLPEDEATTLVKLCFEKTQGNPFFLNQFLQMLYKEKLIQFDISNKKWKWEIAEIQKRQITDNVVDLMANKIQKFPENTQNVLKLAACIGNKFDLRTLSTVNEKSLSKTSIELWDALIEGLIVPISETYNLISEKNYDNDIKNNSSPLESIIPEYRFLHDRVQQAAYSLIDESNRKNIHLKVGRLLLEKNTKDKNEENLFDIVTHLNIGSKLITNELERKKLIELNLLVSQKAKLSAAFEPAYNYAINALSLLENDFWINNFNLSLLVHLEAAETAYLSVNFESMEKLVETVLEKDITLVDKAKIYKIKILALIAKHDSLGAIQTALEILELLGYKLSANPSQEEIGQALMGTMQSLSKFQIIELLELPIMQDKEKIATMQIINLIFSACYQVAPGLFPMLVFTMIELSINNGNSPASAIGYSCYGLILCGIVGDINSGYQFGQLALNLTDKLQEEKLKANTWFNVNIFTRHWKEPVKNTIKPALEAYQIGIVMGDFEYASWSALLHNLYSYFSGIRLTTIVNETLKFRKAILELKQETAFNYISMFSQALMNLTFIGESPWILIGETYNEQEMLPIHQKANDGTALYYFYFHKTILSFLFEEQEHAIKNSEMAEQYLVSVPSTQMVILFHFYDSLIKLTQYPNVSLEEKEVLLNKIISNQTKMKTWADHCAENCLHKYYLVEAEKANVLGEDLLAIDCYTKSISLAKQNEFLQEEALANELFGRFWLLREKIELAQMNLNKAYHLYIFWGAGAKAHQLENKYGHLLTKIGKSKNSTTIQGNSTVSSLDENTQALDLVSVMKASQAISKEIVIDQLLKNMMHIVIENAGAQTGFLIQEKKGIWVIVAEGSSIKESDKVFQSKALLDSKTGNYFAPASILQYVARTKESIVLDDASNKGNFISDSYIIKNQPKSILCSAIVYQGKIIGILYMENNSITGVFTKERLEVLQLLSSQVAISLENATLYANLEDKVKERTVELEVAHQKILVLEKETTEKQLAGGFAHEMRNALVGPKLVIQHILGQEGNEPYESLNLINRRKLKEIYSIIKDKVPDETLQNSLQSMKSIFENQEQIDSSLSLIQRAVTKGLAITQLIMDYSKVGNEQKGKEFIDINTLLKNITTEYKNEWETFNIIIDLDLTDKQTKLFALETHFESVFKNLLLNAKDAILDKNLIDKKEKMILVKTDIIDSSFHIEFIDNGIGISTEHINKIYDAFFSTKPDTGMGLGLGVVKKIINLYNGKIEVKSEIGEGTSFRVIIPLNEGNKL